MVTSTSAVGRSEFLKEVIADTPGGERLMHCLQCGSCGGSCPSGADMEYTPRTIFAMIAANRRREVLAANTMWYCVSCYFCTTRCPQEIPITEIDVRPEADVDRRGPGHGHRRPGPGQDVHRFGGEVRPQLRVRAGQPLLLVQQAGQHVQDGADGAVDVYPGAHVIEAHQDPPTRPVAGHHPRRAKEIGGSS